MSHLPPADLARSTPPSSELAFKNPVTIGSLLQLTTAVTFSPIQNYHEREFLVLSQPFPIVLSTPLIISQQTNRSKSRSKQRRLTSILASGW